MSRSVKHSSLSLSLLLLLLGCGGLAPRLVPPGQQLVAEVQGQAARLRVFTLPPLQTPKLPGVLLVYVELHNRGTRSLRVAYPDLWLGDGRTRRIPPLRPGDVLRPGVLTGGHRRLLASAAPGLFFGRARPPEPPTRPEALSDWDSGGSSFDFFSPTARTMANNHWIMRNDYTTGMQLTTAGWPFFGLPRPGTAMSLFEILQSTLPDGVLLPRGTMSGFLFFPPAARPFAAAGLRWDARDALSDETVETVSLPLAFTDGP